MISFMDKVFKYSYRILRLDAVFYVCCSWQRFVNKRPKLQLKAMYASVFFESKNCQNENDFYELFWFMCIITVLWETGCHVHQNDCFVVNTALYVC